MAGNPKRERPEWDEYFMHNAFWAATRSSCVYLQTGAVIVRDKRVIATGYNGAPPNIESCLKKGCRKAQEGVDFHDKGRGVCRGTHAEINAMSQIARQDLNGASLYTLYFPCSACAKAIAGNGLAKVIYCAIYKEIDNLTRELLAEAGISLRQLKFDLKKHFKMLEGINPGHRK